MKRGFLNDRTDEIDISGLVQAYLFGERKIVAGGNVKNSFQQFVGIKGRQHARRNADDFFQQRLQLLPQFFVFGDVENAFAGSGAEKRTGGVNGKAVPKCLQRKAVGTETDARVGKLTKDNSAKAVSVEYMPYIMNFLGIIYLNYAHDNRDEKDFKITKSLFETAIKHQDLITSPLHLGCIYYHLGQLYDCGTRYMENRPGSYFKGAIEFYRQAQRYLGKYTYPYDYGYISYRLSHLFFNFWRQKEDIQALRDAVFQLREAEKIYTYALFPDFWAVIQGELGQMLGLLGNLTKSEDISELAVNCYRNQQKVITERRDPITWALAQENIGDIYYRIGKNSEDRPHLEDALECYHDALYIFENAGNEDKIKNIMTSIARTNQCLNLI